uniref:NADH dehydrogenase subunit 6 n=1 Tax=Ooencyrtus plautus TaxID=2989845 RepID=UPI0022370569|nr:NADH dehydrogenase subunit 6 [Ooencyrtus plautus]UYP50998.1 NADH dehydrogenase subunit 6 [Ooencyrtus plautus]
MKKSIFNLLIFFIINISLILLIINIFPSSYKMLHPMILGSVLFLFNILMSFNLSLYLDNNWWSFISFLIIIGGLMILFLYFTSFINNMIMSMKMIFWKNFMLKMVILILFIFMMMFYKNKFLIWYKFKEMNYLNLNFLKLLLLYMYMMNLMNLMSIFYLLLTLTLIVKMILMNKYTLRKIN